MAPKIKIPQLTSLYTARLILTDQRTMLEIWLLQMRGQHTPLRRRRRRQSTPFNEHCWPQLRLPTMRRRRRRRPRVTTSAGRPTVTRPRTKYLCCFVVLPVTAAARLLLLSKSKRGRREGRRDGRTKRRPHVIRYSPSFPSSLLPPSLPDSLSENDAITGGGGVGVVGRRRGV